MWFLFTYTLNLKICFIYVLFGVSGCFTIEIKFWLKDEIIEGGFRFHVCTLYKMQSNPFKIGDIINLEMFPLKQNGDKQYFNKQNKLHLKTIKLVEQSFF